MKWFILSGIFLSGVAFAVESNTSTTRLPAMSDQVSRCRTPEGKEYQRGQLGYKNCMKRKRINREEKKMPDFDNNNNGMQMNN